MRRAHRGHGREALARLGQAAPTGAGGRRVLNAIPPSAWVVALGEHGERWGTADLARRLADWQRLRRDVALLVGGADGFDPRCLGRADQRWSLSPLTLPHALVRVIGRGRSLADYFPGLRPLWSDGVVIPGLWLATTRLRSEGAALQNLTDGGIAMAYQTGHNDYEPGHDNSTERR